MPIAKYVKKQVMDGAAGIETVLASKYAGVYRSSTMNTNTTPKQEINISIKNQKKN